MPTHYANCLYVHGLHSNVNEDKVAIMEKYFGKVTARHIKYATTPDAYLVLKLMCTEHQVDFIIGSSFGGYLGYYLSKELSLPSILFNPAMFAKAQDDTFITKEIVGTVPFSLFVVGEKDDVIPPGSIEQFVSQNASDDHIQMIRCDWLEHRIDLHTFEAMISAGIQLAQAA